MQESGLGNQNDLVGRYFMEHPILDTGDTALVVLSDSNISTALYRKTLVNDVWVTGFLGLSPEARRNERLLNCGIRLMGARPEGVASLHHIFGAIRQGHMPNDFTWHLGRVLTDLDDVAKTAYRKIFGQKANPTLFSLMYWGEPMPNRDSRVSLSPERDSLGKHRVRLDWRLGEMDLHTMRRAHEILGEELGRAGLGRLKIAFDETGPAWPPSLGSSCHHMGTTRMQQFPLSEKPLIFQQDDGVIGASFS